MNSFLLLESVTTVAITLFLSVFLCTSIIISQHYKENKKMQHKIKKCKLEDKIKLLQTLSCIVFCLGSFLTLK